jgi:hypothetical protein
MARVLDCRSDLQRVAVAVCLTFVVTAACGGRSNLDLDRSGDEGASGSGGEGGGSGSGGHGASGSGSGGVSGSNSGALFGGGSPDFPDAYGSTPSTCDEGPPPRNGEACSDVGATCIVPNPDSDCSEIQCECDPPGVFHCQGLDCVDGSAPFSDAGLVDGPAVCPSTEARGPCFNQGVVCTYSMVAPRAAFAPGPIGCASPRSPAPTGATAGSGSGQRP